MLSAAPCPPLRTTQERGTHSFEMGGKRQTPKAWGTRLRFVRMRDAAAPLAAAFRRHAHRRPPTRRTCKCERWLARAPPPARQLGVAHALQGGGVPLDGCVWRRRCASVCASQKKQRDENRNVGFHSETQVQTNAAGLWVSILLATQLNSSTASSFPALSPREVSWHVLLEHTYRTHSVLRHHRNKPGTLQFSALLLPELSCMPR